MQSPDAVLIPSLISALVPLPVAIAIAPRLLALAGQPLAEPAAALRTALAPLDVAWLTAAQTWRGRFTAQALQDCRQAAAQALEACTGEVERLSAALQTSSAIYRRADAEAVPLDGPGGN